MEVTAPIGSRGFLLIPQAYEGGGYYVYGTPDKGRGQYAHPQLISALLDVARSWSYLDKRKCSELVTSAWLAAKSSQATSRIEVDLKSIFAQCGKMEIACLAQSLISSTIATPPPH